MDNTKIKSNRIINTNGIDNSKLPADKKISGSSLRAKLDEMIKTSGISEKIKAVEKIAENTIKLGFEKAVAHFENPSLYPLPVAGKNLEGAVFDLLNSLPKKKRNKLIDKINETLKAPAEKRKQVYGDITNVDLRSSVSVQDQVMNIPALKKYSLSSSEFSSLSDKFKNPSPAKNIPVPQQAASASKLGFFVDNMTCLNPDDALKDEVSIAGFIIDSIGNTTELAPQFISKFRKNETVNLGANSKLFTVNIDSLLLEQSFIANLFIVESDLVENPDALFNAILVVSIIAATLLAVSVGIVVAGILGAAVTPEAFLITLFSGAVMTIISQNILPLIGDDISNITADTLTIIDKVDVGETFTRTLTIGKGFDLLSTFDGKYSASARWVGEL